MGKRCSAGNYRAIVGVELTASSRVIVCYSQLCSRSGGGIRMWWQPAFGWLVGWFKMEISPIRTCKFMAKGRFFPRRFIAHRCSDE